VAKTEVALPMLDACALLDQRLDNIPSLVPYFNVPEEEVQRHLLPETSKLRVGLCWAGASRPENMNAHAIDKRRSVAFELLEPILALSKDVQFLSLQMEDHRVDDERLIQPITDKFDVLDTMGVIKQLDLIITIDSSVCHMAASIGKPTWMLSRFDGCWRWHYNEYSMTEQTDWYPTMRIFRQKGLHTWPEIVERVVDALEEVIVGGSLEYSLIGFAAE
jgi:hypothetical protein